MNSSEGTSHVKKYSITSTCWTGKILSILWGFRQAQEICNFLPFQNAYPNSVATSCWWQLDSFTYPFFIYCTQDNFVSNFNVYSDLSSCVYLWITWLFYYVWFPMIWNLVCFILLQENLDTPILDMTSLFSLKNRGITLLLCLVTWTHCHWQNVLMLFFQWPVVDAVVCSQQILEWHLS